MVTVNPQARPDRSRGRTLLALGVFLARRGATGWVAVALSGATTLGFVGLAGFVAHRGRGESLVEVPLVASSALAFGVGVLLAFSASTRVFRRDEDEGVRALLEAHAVSRSDYLLLRVLGLAAVLAVLVGGGSFGVGAASVLLARSRPVALHAAQSSLAGAVFGVAFAVTMAPVALATLASRSRAGGYLALLAVLVLPELAEPFLSRVLPPGWGDVASIPGALLALRHALAPRGVDLRELGRGVSVLVAVVVASSLVARAELRRPHASTLGPRGGRPLS